MKIRELLSQAPNATIKCSIERKQVGYYAGMDNIESSCVELKKPKKFSLYHLIASFDATILAKNLKKPFSDDFVLLVS